MIFMKETYHPQIIELKTRQLRKETGDQTLKSKYGSEFAFSKVFARALTRPIKMLFFSPIVLLLSLYVAIVYGYLYLLFTTIPEVFIEKYGFSQGNVGLAYLGLGVGMMIGVAAVGTLSDYLLKRLTRKHGKRKPEFRMPSMIPGAILVPAGVFIYGWTAEYGIHWIVPIIGTSILGMGILFILVHMSLFLLPFASEYL